MIWAPYRNLIHYTYNIAKYDVSLKNLGNDTIELITGRRASKLLSSGMSPAFINEKYEWEKPKYYDASNATSRRLSIKLTNFLHKKDHKSRRALEQLLLSYLSSGFSMEDSVEFSYADYKSIGDWILPMSQSDVFIFANLFWDWQLVPEMASSQSEYARTILCHEDRSIFFGATTTDEVRLNVGAKSTDDLQSVVMRVASLMGSCIQKEMKRLILEGNILKDSRPFIAMATLTASLQSITKGALDMNESTGQMETLESFILQKGGSLDSDTMDYAAQEGYVHASPEILREITGRNNMLLIDTTKNDLT